MRDFVISYANELSPIKMAVSVMAPNEFLLVNVSREIHSNITAYAHWCSVITTVMNGRSA